MEVDLRAQVDVAREHRVSPQLVWRLLKRCRQDPEHLQKVQRKRDRKQEEKEAAAAIIREHMRVGRPIYSTNQMHTEVLAAGTSSLTAADVQQIMREDCGLSFRRTVP